MTPHDYPFNPETDLLLDRVVDVPPERVWAAWTRPEQVVKWFTPAPWSTSEAHIDLRPGGRYDVVMCSPEGQLHANPGCLLEVVPNQRLVLTDAVLADFRPSVKPFFTAVLTLTPSGSGTRYHVHAMHPSAEGRKQHEEMGFADGWGKALDQLVAHAKSY